MPSRNPRMAPRSLEGPLERPPRGNQEDQRGPEEEAKRAPEKVPAKRVTPKCGFPLRFLLCVYFGRKSRLECIRHYHLAVCSVGGSPTPHERLPTRTVAKEVLRSVHSSTPKSKVNWGVHFTVDFRELTSQSTRIQN